MSFEIITIPFNPFTKGFHTDDLNKFCLNKKIIQKHIQFFQVYGETYWAVFLEFETVIGQSIGDTKGLTEAGRLCYEKLRQWRKETAEKEGVPPFVIAKNSHLIDIVKKEIKTLEALKQIEGIGKKKIEKYGKDILDIVKAFFEISHDI